MGCLPERQPGGPPALLCCKLEADECLTALAKRRVGDFQAIVLRRGSLTDEKPTGRVTLGKTKARENVSRGDVADVAVRLLEGEERVAEAVERAEREGVDCVGEEDVDEMVKRYSML